MVQATPQPGEAASSGPLAADRPSAKLVFGADVPLPNPYFIGREAELTALRGELGGGVFPAVRRPPSVLHGLGGVGKTMIATEYVHRYAKEYEAVWWVEARIEQSILDSLLSLGPALQLSDLAPDDPNRSLRAVIEALQSGDPYERWLLVFDDVAKPEILRRFIPQGTGHVIVTSRISEWRQVLNTDGIPVKEFSRSDTIEFLRTRVPELARRPDAGAGAGAQQFAEANRLAETLDDLPLAVEHAAAYLSQMQTSVSAYIEAFDRNAQDLFNEDADMFGVNHLVARTWNLTQQKLSPGAKILFCLLAFFAPEPIAEEILIRPGWVPPSPALPAVLQRVLASRDELNRAERELKRLSLITWHGPGGVVQLNRVVQAVTKAHTESDEPEIAAGLKQTVLGLLAATDPGAPEPEQNDPTYQWSIRHLVPAGALKSRDRSVRTLIINQVRRLRMRSSYQEALLLAEAARADWGSEPDNTETLALSVELAIVLRLLGQTKESLKLNTETLNRLYAANGEDDPTYLACANSHGEDLRLAGRYQDAFGDDSALLPAYARVFTPDEVQTLNLRNNIALDMRCVGHYAESLSFDKATAELREPLFGPAHWQTLSSTYGISSSLRRIGRYQQALDIADKAAEIMEAPENPPMPLLQILVLAGRSVSVRRVGRRQEAHALAEEVYARSLEYAGPEHRITLLAATNLMCDRRLVNDLGGAQKLGEETVASWDKLVGPDHPNALIARANLALILRSQGSLLDAQAMNRKVLDGFREVFSSVHPYHLIVMTNLASDLALVGAVREARKLGDDVIEQGERIQADVLPITLVAAANLALDMRATGDEDQALDLETRTLATLDRELSAGHPEAVLARQRARLNLDIEPAML